MNKNFSANEMSELNRMKALMNYGRVNEEKQAYSGIENTKVGADGKTYGIIREGTKFYIKVSDKKNPLVENFEYIGGFRNRKDYEYSSFAIAQKNLDMKMKSINEAYQSPSQVIRSWENKGENNQEITEATKTMMNEIARQRQIMGNVARIDENKEQKLDKIDEGCKNECGAPFCEDPEKEFKDAQKPNMKGGPEKGGDPKKANKGYKKVEVKESSEVLGFNRDNDDYMDKSHGTEIGDSAPFDDATARNIDDDKKVSETGEMKNGVVEEGESMHDSDSQNTPTPGTGEIGDNDPFDGEMGKQIDEAIEDIEDDNFDEFDDDADLEDSDMDDLSDDELSSGNEEDEVIDDVVDDDVADGDDIIDDTEEVIEDEPDSELENRLSSLEDLVSKIAEKLGVSTYEDEDLYADDSEGFEDDGDDFEDEGEFDDDDYDEDGFEDDDDEVQTFESRAYKAMKLNESNRLNDFGKHPAYQKKVMTLPKVANQEMPDYYDMNDESVYSEQPYGQKIGDGAPFEVDPESIVNAIAESLKRVLKKK